MKQTICYRILINLVIVLLLGVTSSSSAGSCSFKNGDKNSIPPKEHCIIWCNNFGVDDPHPGSVAAQLTIDSASNCSYVDDWELNFSDCLFPDNRLDVDWFSTNVATTFQLLSFSQCKLEQIDDGFLDQSLAFRNTIRELRFGYNPIAEISAGFLSGVTSPNFAILRITQSNLARVDSEMLTTVAATLENIQIGGVNFKVAFNLTGNLQEAKFPKLRVLTYDFSGESEPLSKKWLSALSDSPNLQQISFAFSNIGTVKNNTFNVLNADNLTLLSFYQNDLQTIPNGTLDHLVKHTVLDLEINDNPWHCDCHLEYLVNLFKSGKIRTVPGVIIYPTCASPPSQRGRKIVDADLTTECVPLEEIPEIEI